MYRYYIFVFEVQNQYCLRRVDTEINLIGFIIDKLKKHLAFDCSLICNKHRIIVDYPLL